MSTPGSCKRTMAPNLLGLPVYCDMAAEFWQSMIYASAKPLLGSLLSAP